MNSKTSFFNNLFSKSVIKSDIKRHWWASAVLMVLYLLFLFSSISDYEHEINNTFSDFLWYTDRGSLSFCAAFILAGLLFSYLHKSSSVSFMHGIPVTRTQQYFSHIISGFVIILIPILLITSLVASKSPFASEYFCLTATVSLLFFSIVTMVSTLVGNRFAAMIFSAGLMLFPAYIELLKGEFLERAIRGYVASPSIFKYLYIQPDRLPENHNFLIYVGLSIACLIIGFITYKYRNLENSSEIVAFNWLRPIFMIIVTFCFSTFAYIISDRNIVISFIAGVVTLGASFMLIQKSITLKGSLKYFIIYISAFIITTIVIALDVFGYTKNVPDINNVKSASFYDTIYYDSAFLLDEHFVDKSELNEDEKQLLIDFHKDIANMSSGEYSSSGYFRSISFEYDLKLGGKLRRNYHVPYDLVKKHSDLFNTWAFVQNTYPFLNPHNKITSISMYDRSITFSSEEITEFTKALVSDLKNHTKNKTFIDTIDYDIHNKSTIAEIYICYGYNDTNRKDSYYMDLTSDYPEAMEYINKYINKNFTNDNITNITVTDESDPDSQAVVYTFDEDDYSQIMDLLSKDIISLDSYYAAAADNLTNNSIILEVAQNSDRPESMYKISVTLGSLSDSKTADTNKHYEFYIPVNYHRTINYINEKLNK